MNILVAPKLQFNYNMQFIAINDIKKVSFKNIVILPFSGTLKAKIGIRGEFGCQRFGVWLGQFKSDLKKLGVKMIYSSSRFFWCQNQGSSTFLPKYAIFGAIPCHPYHRCHFWHTHSKPSSKVAYWYYLSPTTNISKLTFPKKYL